MEWVYPEPDFTTRNDAYETVGRIFSAVESVVKAVNKRDFYFANVDEKNKSETKVKLMDKWESEVDGSRFIEELVRTWLKMGHAIIGPDWKFVNMKLVQYKKRDLYGKTKEIILNIGGREWPLGAVEERGMLVKKIPIEDYIETSYIHDSRDAWGRNLYYPICTTFDDIDGKPSTAIYKGFRQMEQDGIRMHHKIAAQKTLWIFPKLKNPKDLNVENPKSLAYRIHMMRPGDSLVGGPDFEGAEIKTDGIDGKTRFPEVTELIKGEVEVTAQSSAGRLIEDPSAMADAEQAREQDDDTTLYVCELVRRLFDYVIIPKVVGDMSVEFRWGSSDNADFNFNEMLQAVQAGIISKEEAREQMRAAGKKLDDTLFQKTPAPAAIPDSSQDDGEIQELRKQAYRKVIDELDKAKGS